MDRKKNNWLRACLQLWALLWLLGCAYGSEQTARAPVAVETEVANEVGEDTNSSTFQAAEERGGEWWLEYSAYDLRRTREVVQEAYKRPHPVHEDINVWVYTQDFADRFGMPQRWVDPELQGAEALAYRLELHLERTCSYSDSGNWDICREVKDYCYLDIYVRSDAPIPWNTDLQIWHRYKLRHSINMLQHSYGPASGFLSEQAQRDYQYGYSRRGLYVNKHGIDDVTWAADFSWWGGEPSRRGGGAIYLFEREVFEGLDLISLEYYCRFARHGEPDMEIWFFDKKTKEEHFAESQLGSKKLNIDYRVLPGARFMRRVKRFNDERGEQRYNLK